MTAEKTILVVDDNSVNRKILCKILTSDGYHTIEADNGQKALDILTSGKQVVHLILLDIVMPIMNGYELLHIMNETGMISTIPVIIITGNEQEETEIRCLKEGASDFLRKPYNKQMVRHRVSSILRLWDNAMLVNQLKMDHLTGVYNQQCFYMHAEELLQKYPNDAFAMLYVNIVDFKLINAHYGTAEGDNLLRYFAKTMQDDVGDNGICGRIGADIFAVLIRQRPLPSQEEVGEAYAQNFKDSPVKGLSIKCGIYPITDRSLSISDMSDRAKLAEESIKHQYGVYYALYNDSLRQEALREHQLANYMEEALETHQFLVYLQPKHSTETGAVAGAEALVRWIHPELGFISPGEFIPLFERNGFIVKLDYFVWQEVCSTLRKWMDAGEEPVPISVNASRADFMSPELPEKISDLVDTYDIPPELLHVEVTESAYTDNPQQIIAAVSTLRDMGFKIEMDDFGSGYSSLNMLSELPIDILKLDMRFMQSGNDKLKGSKRNILSFIVSLSKWLQLPTVAEGVETKEEFELLKSMGCDLIQGYYFSKPMPIADFEEYMNSHRKPLFLPPVEKMIISHQIHRSTGKKPLLLVVEDIPSNRNVMKALLSAEYDIATAENGAVAYEYIKEHYREIACILLDLLMPVMDGFQLLELLHNNPIYSEIPVIITTETGSNGELRALNLGAHSFVSKPYNPDVLRHHVRKAVEEKEFLKIRRAYEREANTLYEKAYQDDLTGFLNRYGLKEAIHHFPPKMTNTVIIMDINNLKHVHDAYGHVAGDELMTAIAAVIRKNTRNGDVLSRIDSAEFIIILRGLNNPDIAQSKTQQLCAAIHAIDTTPEPPSCSAGIALSTDIENDFDAVYRHADSALSAAKADGNAAFRLWTKA